MALAGRSNVGKSSLLNALTRTRGLARTSRVPGRTRAIVFFRVQLKLRPAGRRTELVLADLPGYGYAQVTERERRRWKPLVESYLSRRPTLRGVVLVVDARRGLESDEHQLLAYLAAHRRPALIVATKADRLGRGAARAAAARMAAEAGGAPLFLVSARTREGVGELMDAIVDLALAVGVRGFDNPQGGGAQR